MQTRSSAMHVQAYTKYLHIVQYTCAYVISCLRCFPDVEENEEGDITSFTITPLQPVFKGARTYKLGAPTEAVSAAQLALTLEYKEQQQTLTSCHHYAWTH